jgi:ABC-type transporter Mla MlaB component
MTAPALSVSADGLSASLAERTIPACGLRLLRADRTERIRLAGRASGESWPTLDRAVADLRRIAPRRLHPAVHLDLSDVTALDSTAVRLLDRAYREIDRMGWRFEVTPPRADAPSATFIRAAIAGRFGWASGTAHS